MPDAHANTTTADRRGGGGFVGLSINPPPACEIEYLKSGCCQAMPASTLRLLAGPEGRAFLASLNVNCLFSNHPRQRQASSPDRVTFHSERAAAMIRGAAAKQEPAFKSTAPRQLQR